MTAQVSAQMPAQVAQLSAHTHSPPKGGECCAAQVVHQRITKQDPDRALEAFLGLTREVMRAARAPGS